VKISIYFVLVLILSRFRLFDWWERGKRKHYVVSVFYLDFIMVFAAMEFVSLLWFHHCFVEVLFGCLETHGVVNDFPLSFAAFIIFCLTVIWFTRKWKKVQAWHG